MLSFTPQLPSFQVNIERADPRRLTLSWTTNAASWTLESAGSATAPVWNTITNLPVVSGTNFSVTVDTDGAQQFFRLRAP